MKYILLGFLVFILYRMIFKPKPLNPGPKNPPLQEKDSEGFVDYEEIE